ncbi:flagellar basal body rod protein FlgC [Rubrivivax gelatinosus]|uniref:Flagellar basal-body rod protein FlgC n=1 Tax=Rubrivivax gelatinosus TaxID=28068 RepID=A0ABS1E1E3_RUBGE|nr:flagellar basal body rod protein FlgC [Rubrivivax gelatinosus]MBK1616478.1 flagellar basal body rod protein FlgC [Rubrivivax gelatinosus]MBK1715690.1 flagellar basal body rod protein FlgC [Rubrivivax gelatinosus]
MSFRQISEIAGSAMAAQTVRLNTVASNLANAQSAAGTEAAAYHARKPVFAAIAQARGQDGGYAGTRVQVLDVVQSTEPLRKVHEPDNPLADGEGMVYYPNVSPVAEMTDMMAASRAFETNVEVMTRVRGMQQSLLRMGKEG